MPKSQASPRRPAIVADEAEAADEAFNGVRRRPVLARVGSELVVCCSRTARKHGWEILGRLFQRSTGS